MSKNSTKKNMEQEENEYYGRLGCKGILLIFTPLEVNHLNNMLELAWDYRRILFIKDARKQKRHMSDVEEYLLMLDRKLWKKISAAKDLALKHSSEYQIIRKI